MCGTQAACPRSPGELVGEPGVLHIDPATIVWPRTTNQLVAMVPSFWWKAPQRDSANQSWPEPGSMLGQPSERGSTLPVVPGDHMDPYQLMVQSVDTIDGGCR
jgi:hypothetical protein